MTYCVQLARQAALLLVATLLLSGCASIVSGSKPNFVSLTSSPTGASFTINNQQGRVIHTGTTPAYLPLKASDGFFDRADYTITMSKKGYAEKTTMLSASLDGWYLGGNLLLFGAGLLGWLIIDPATGAMWTLENETVTVSLQPLTP